MLYIPPGSYPSSLFSECKGFTFARPCCSHFVSSCLMELGYFPYQYSTKNPCFSQLLARRYHWRGKAAPLTFPMAVRFQVAQPVVQIQTCDGESSISLGMGVLYLDSVATMLRKTGGLSRRRNGMILEARLLESA